MLHRVVRAPMDEIREALLKLGGGHVARHDGGDAGVGMVFVQKRDATQYALARREHARE